jgi:hypothetical protein
MTCWAPLIRPRSLLRSPPRNMLMRRDEKVLQGVLPACCQRVLTLLRKSRKEGAARLFGWKQADSRQRVAKDTCGKLAAWRGIDGGWWCESVASFMWGGVKKISRREVSVTLSFQRERARRRPVNRCPPVPFKASSFMLSPHTSTRSP